LPILAFLKPETLLLTSSVCKQGKTPARDWTVKEDRGVFYMAPSSSGKFVSFPVGPRIPVWCGEGITVQRNTSGEEAESETKEEERIRERRDGERVRKATGRD
jgi:hypothetical protein